MSDSPPETGPPDTGANALSPPTDDLPPGPDRLPIVGNTFDYLSDPLEFWRETAAEYGPVAYYELGSEGFYQLSDPELVEQVLVHDNEHYRKGDLFQQTLGPPLGDGLLTSEGSFWRTQRHAIQPAFDPDRLNAYASTMVDRTAHATADWTDGEVRNVHEDAMRLTAGIAAEALFGVEVDDFEDAVSDALAGVMDQAERNARRPVDIPEWLPTPGNRQYRRALATLESVSDVVVERQLAAMAEGVSGTDEQERQGGPSARGPPGAGVGGGGGGAGPNIVRLLRESDADASREQLRDEVVTLLLAGHETTALALTYTFHLLGRNPDIAARLRAELDGTLDGRRPSMDDLPDLTYTEAVIKEAMRLYPPVHELLREPIQDVELGGYRIPEGSTITAHQWVLHRDPDVFDDPTSFRPERWTSGLTDSLPKFSYFPFGGGPRRCIGDRFAMQEARLVLATVASEWTFEPQQDLSFAPSITLRPDGPVPMRVRRR